MIVSVTIKGTIVRGDILAKPGRKKKTVKNENVVQDIIETTEIVENTENANSNIEEATVMIDTEEILEESTSTTVEHEENETVSNTIESAEKEEI